MSDGRCRWSSVSPHLGWQFNQLVARCGFDPVITKSTKRSHNVGRDIWLGHYNARDKTVIRVDLRQSDDEYVWNPITRKREVEYEGTVYDLSVEDANSFVVEGATVHNCRGRANDPHHAIGHVLLVHGTLDEEMWAMLDEKRGVIDAVRDGIEVPEDQMTVEEQLRLAWMDRGKRVIDLL